MNEFPQSVDRNVDPTSYKLSSPDSIPTFVAGSGVTGFSPVAANDVDSNARVDATLEHLVEIERKLNEGEFVGASLEQCSSPIAATQPSLEANVEKETPFAEIAPTQNENGKASNKISISYQVTASSQLIHSDEGKPPAADSDISEEGLHEFDLAMNLLTRPGQEEAATTPVDLTARVKPPLNLDPISNELVLDVRDFVDSQGIPIPILNAYRAEATSDPFDGQEKGSASELVPSEASKDGVEVNQELSTDISEIERTDLGHAIESSQEKTFLVGNDEVITIHGADGFDAIDLQCFDVAYAKFTPNQILINDGNGIHFRIEYRDISIALFANDCTIDLNKPH